LVFGWIKAKVAADRTRAAALSTCMAVLNKEFFDFVRVQVVDNPMSLWTGAVEV
jgi:hypothetical protein